MFQVPTSLQGLLSLLAPCFTQPSFETFSLLVAGAISRVRDRTICGMLQAAGVAGVWHHSRAHDFFARRRWEPDDLGLRLLEFLVRLLVGADAPVCLAVDDTLFARAGRKVYASHYLHDAALPEGAGYARWGNCWVVLALVVSLPCSGGRPVALPVLFRLFRPSDSLHPQRLTLAQLGRSLADKAIERLPDRRVHVLFDGAYASRAWRGLPERVTVTTRVRANAALYELAPPRSGKPGRPWLRGPRLESLGELASTAPFSPITITAPDGRQRTTHAHRLQCLWYGPFHAQPLSVLLIRHAGTHSGYDIALASTDTSADSAALISRYDSRWTIETCHQEAKAHGVGQARNRVQRAVERTVPFGFLTQTITIAWYHLHGNPDRDLRARRLTAPWYRHKTTISYTDMLAALRRELIRAEFHAQAPRATTPPKTHTAAPLSAIAGN